MRRPHHVEVVPVVEGERRALALQLVEDDPVQDAAHGHVAAVERGQQAAALALELGGADRAHPQQVRGGVEVGPRLLGGGIEVEQDHFLGGGVGDHRAPQQRQVAVMVEAGEEAGPALRHFRDPRQHLSPDLALHQLHAVEGREPLQLDEARHQPSRLVLGDGQVNGVEVGKGVAARGAVALGHGRLAPGDDLGPAQDLLDLAGHADAGLAQVRGQQQGGLRQPELETGCGQALVHERAHLPVEVRAVVPVEDRPEYRIHRAG